MSDSRMPSDRWARALQRDYPDWSPRHVDGAWLAQKDGRTITSDTAGDLHSLLTGALRSELGESEDE